MVAYARREDLLSSKWISGSIVPCLIIEEIKDGSTCKTVVAYVVTPESGPVIATCTVPTDLLLVPEKVPVEVTPRMN